MLSADQSIGQWHIVHLPTAAQPQAEHCSEAKTLDEFSEVDPKGRVDSIKKNREEMETRTQTALAGSLTREKKHVFIGKRVWK